MRVESFWLNQQQMAKSCRVSLSGFQKWEVQPEVKIGRHTYYSAAAVLANRLAHWENQISQAASRETDQEPSSADREARLRLTLAQAEGQEIKNAQLRKELAPVHLLEWVVGKAGAQISAILDAIPMQLKKRNAKLTASNIELIRRDIVKAQNAAAQMTVDIDAYYQEDAR